MNNATYNIIALCKIQNKPLPKYINIPEDYAGDLNWKCNIYKLVGENYHLVDSFFKYEKASNEAKKIMEISPAIKHSVLSLLRK